MAATRPSRPSVNHLVLNVRDIEASHRFYCEGLGFEQCGTLETPFSSDVDMRFYRGHPDHHHDFALAQIPDPSSAPPVPTWGMFTNHPGIAHIALAYDTREEWLAQLEHMQSYGIKTAVRGNHGMTHSAYVVDPDGNGIEVLYELPSEVWEGDVNAALSHFEPLPNDGPESLVDNTDYVRFGAAT
ncbi:MAG: VOC family protein [Ilumatobacteraceae bacterium]